MTEFSSKSPEELRLEDYARGNVHPHFAMYRAQRASPPGAHTGRLEAVEAQPVPRLDASSSMATTTTPGQLDPRASGARAEVLCNARRGNPDPQAFHVTRELMAILRVLRGLHRARGRSGARRLRHGLRALFVGRHGVQREKDTGCTKTKAGQARREEDKEGHQGARAVQGARAARRGREVSLIRRRRLGSSRHAASVPGTRLGSVSLVFPCGASATLSSRTTTPYGRAGPRSLARWTSLRRSA